ncbi:MAG TPA: hypothetical protein VN682_05670 [Terriglobales bacterium]|nr:hypothetical protein [Terriglobales bacterium]
MQDDVIDPRWSFIRRIPFGWLRTLYENVPSGRIPLFTGETVLAATDTSGGQRGSRYSVTGVLLIDNDNSLSWHKQRLTIRKRYLSDGRRMSFKNLNDCQRRAALIPFLRAADDIRGLLVVMAFDKRLGSLCTSRDLYDEAGTAGILKARWKHDAFEQMMRTVQLVSTLFASVVKRGQNLYWISDMDDCLANQERKADTARMMNSFTSEYIHHQLGELGIGTTELDEGDRLEEDLTAIPDVAAGAMCDLLNRMHEHHGTFPLIPTFVPDLKSKTDLISSWFFHEGGSLVKLAWVGRLVRKGHMQFGSFRTET